jgi:hypothetical protein
MKMASIKIYGLFVVVNEVLCLQFHHRTSNIIYPLKILVNQNGYLLVWASCYECKKKLDFLKLFQATNIHGSFPMSRCM